MEEPTQELRLGLRAAWMTDGSIRHRAAVSAAVARLLPSDNLGSAAPSRSTGPLV